MEQAEDQIAPPAVFRVGWEQTLDDLKHEVGMLGGQGDRLSDRRRRCRRAP
jgi:hypothetical protein